MGITLEEFVDNNAFILSTRHNMSEISDRDRTGVKRSREEEYTATLRSKFGNKNIYFQRGGGNSEPYLLPLASGRTFQAARRNLIKTIRGGSLWYGSHGNIEVVVPRGLQ